MAAFFKAPKSQKENVYSCSKCYIILNIHCFSHLPYLCMILIVKVTLDNIFHILLESVRTFQIEF